MGGFAVTAARLRQWWADLLASFWVRPALMTVAAIALAEALVRAEGAVWLPEGLDGWVYAGAAGGARDVLGVLAGAIIGVAGTTFSMTVAALTLASNQMGPRLLRNFTRDAGNQYALGAFLSTFAYALVALRSVQEAAETTFVPQLAVSVGLLMGFGCIGVLIWFLQHVAASISVDRVAALVHQDLESALDLVARPRGEDPPPPRLPEPLPRDAVPLKAPGSGYLRVLDHGALADWAAAQDARLDLVVRPGGFVFPGSIIGHVSPAATREEAQARVADGMSIGDARSVEQDLEFAVRQLVEIALRALSPGINDPFTAIGVLDRLGAALCGLAGRRLPAGEVWRDDRLRVTWPAPDYEGLVDAMFHMLRQNAASQPSVMIRLQEVLGMVAEVEQDPARRVVIRGHLHLVRDLALEGTGDAAARTAINQRHAAALAAAG
ncbi:DUF2254 domain-containing protein [Falsiroseomonas selenitidurans]|uniref:DUF2254 domain-containing protein n=1 Tax=Falsiroseomonas selenitidurans TaxID=2716335 RepID=A0ABX1EET5_9PROT|nr:DUF2254 domain-containing protein [Falsiroseomonas selenitidurans]NKC33415.1 DUF2254 domain-containing protein [Falsiroseomonas selenitidurans]